MYWVLSLCEFEIHDIIIDELHLMLRITDILIRNLIWGMVYFDAKERRNGARSAYLQSFEDAVRSCGLTFKVNKIYKIIGRMQYHNKYYL